MGGGGGAAMRYTCLLQTSDVVLYRPNMAGGRGEERSTALTGSIADGQSEGAGGGGGVRGGGDV